MVVRAVVVVVATVVVTATEVGPGSDVGITAALCASSGERSSVSEAPSTVPIPVPTSRLTPTAVTSSHVFQDLPCG